MSSKHRARRLTGNLIIGAGGLSEIVECKVIDGEGTRTLVARPGFWHLDFEGDPGPSVVNIEALSGTRLKDGGDPMVFIEAWRAWRKNADQQAGITFAAYFSRLHPGSLEASKPRLTESVSSPPKAKRVKTVGRPRITEREARNRAELVQQWNEAKAVGVRQKDFCSDEGILLEDLVKSVNWLAQRIRRGQRA